MADWDSWDSDNIDIDTYLANEEKREKLEQLLQLAHDCWRDSQFAKAEKFYQKVVELAEQRNDLSQMLNARYELATMQRMQGKYKEALGVFTWLIEVAYDLELSRNLTEYDLRYVEGGFRNFLEVGRSLPEMRFVDLERVVDRGLEWLNSISKRNWAAGLRLQRGMLWQSQNQKEFALAELEAALALARRNTDAPSYTLGTHLFRLANLLQDMKKWEDAKNYYREVVESNDNDWVTAYDQVWAWKGLGKVALKQEGWAEAEHCAIESLELARSIESPELMYNAYDLLGDVYWQQKQVAQAVDAKIQALHYVRQTENVENFYSVYRGFAEIRLYQAQQDDPQQFIPKAQQWLRWAMPLAVRLDRQVNSSDRQTKIRTLQAECEAVLSSE